MQETNIDIDIDIEQTDFVEFSSENIHNNVFQRQIIKKYHAENI